MAKTEFGISMNLKCAKNQAEFLGNIASEMERNAVNDMDECMELVSERWKGVNAQSYVKKGQKISGNLRDIATELRKVAGIMEQTAKNTYRLQMKTLQVAERRER